MTIRFDVRDRNLLLAVAVLLIVFAAGLAAGAAIIHLLRPGPRMIRAEIEDFMPPRLPGVHAPGGERREIVLRHGPGALDPRLGLDENQRARVDSLMKEQARKAEELMRDMEPRLKALTDSTDAAIEALLTPDQRERFRELREERREVIRRRFVVPPPPAPPE